MNTDTIETNSGPVIHVAPSPHVFSTHLTTRNMMRDVLIALIPVVLSSVFFFGWFAVKQLLICVTACLAAEAGFTRLRARTLNLNDLSASVTGIILGLSLPAAAPWYVGVIGSAAAIGLGKIVFGGLGMNIFNPAMVGRAFIMIAFSGLIAASGYVKTGSVDIMSQATPLTIFKQTGEAAPLLALIVGNVNGSLGETSSLACLIGGLFLCIRRVASWELSAGVLIGAGAIGGFSNLLNLGNPWTALHHVFGGALLFGAFFIATDPVTSPLTPKGKWIFGVGVGVLIMVLRLFSGYPEGVMFAVLLMNAVTPLINRWTIPRPFGGV